MATDRRKAGHPSRLMAAVALTCGLGLTGCSTTVLSNQSVDACFRAIPIGREAVHDSKATMVGVHRLAAGQVSTHLDPQARAELAAEDNPAICEMTFKGKFAPGQVELAPATEQGDYAEVLVTATKLRLLAAFVTDHAPRAFGGRAS